MISPTVLKVRNKPPIFARRKRSLSVLNDGTRSSALLTAIAFDYRADWHARCYFALLHRSKAVIPRLFPLAKLPAAFLQSARKIFRCHFAAIFYIF